MPVGAPARSYEDAKHDTAISHPTDQELDPLSSFVISALPRGCHAFVNLRRISIERVHRAVANVIARRATTKNDEPTHARVLITQPLVGRLRLVPDEQRRGYWFNGTGTLVPIVWCDSFDRRQSATECGVPNGIRTRVLALKVKKRLIRRLNDRPGEIAGSCAASVS
jgi:hypothetical protein